MANVTLDTTLTKDGQSFQLFVEYDPNTNTVPCIKKIHLLIKYLEIDAGDILMELFEDKINKIIDETDWREIYRSQINTDTFDMMVCDPIPVFFL